KSGTITPGEVARKQGLNEKYLATLWSELNSPEPSFVLDQLRAQWRAAKPAEVDALLAAITQWQSALWRFTTVGHIGKRDGPKAWQVPVTPLASSRELRVALPKAAAGDVKLYLVTSAAGAGEEHNFALWQNPRLVASGRPDLPLRDVRAVLNAFRIQREKVFSN